MRLSTALQRRQRAVVPGSIEGTIWNCPQSWHSRRRAGVSASPAAAADHASFSEMPEISDTWSLSLAPLTGMLTQHLGNCVGYLPNA